MLMSQPADPPNDDREALLRDPELCRAITRVLQGRVPSAEVPDVLQETLLAVHQSTTLPEDPAERRQYIFGIARKKAAENARKRGRTVEGELLGEEAEQVPSPTGADGLNDRDLLDKMAAEVPESQLHTLQCLARHLLGESLTKLAREANLEYDTLYKRVTTLQRRLIQAGKRLGAIGVVLLVLGAAWHLWKPKEQIALPEPPTMPSVAPATSTDHDTAPEPPDPATLQEAGALRGKAFRACMKDDWGVCLDFLDQAKRLDSAGESDPLVKAAREHAETGVRHAYKPGEPRWIPSGPRPYASRAAP
jgi:DNA-directed RNA polymerase specialized sigma24 family protein